MAFGYGSIYKTADRIKWRNIGESGEPAFENKWVNNGDGFVAARFKKVNGEIIVQGVVKDGDAGTVIFTLPEGYRPDSKIKFDNATVGSDGAVTHTGDGNTEVSLNDIRFAL